MSAVIHEGGLGSTNGVGQQTGSVQEIITMAWADTAARVMVAGLLERPVSWRGGPGGVLDGR